MRNKVAKQLRKKADQNAWRIRKDWQEEIKSLDYEVRVGICKEIMKKDRKLNAFVRTFEILLFGAGCFYLGYKISAIIEFVTK